MSKRGAEGILAERAAQREREREEASRPTYVIEAESSEDRNDTPGYRFGSGVGRGIRRTSENVGAVRESNPATGLNDPRLAVWLYIAVVSTAVMFSKKWATVSKAVVSGTHK